MCDTCHGRRYLPETDGYSRAVVTRCPDCRPDWTTPAPEPPTLAELDQIARGLDWLERISPRRRSEYYD